MIDLGIKPIFEVFAAGKKLQLLEFHAFKKQKNMHNLNYSGSFSSRFTIINISLITEVVMNKAFRIGLCKNERTQTSSTETKARLYFF